MKYKSDQIVCASELDLTLKSWEPSKGFESSLIISPLTVGFVSPSRNLSENLIAMMLLTWLIVMELLLCPE